MTITEQEIQQAAAAYAEHGTIRNAADALDKSFGWVQRRLNKREEADTLEGLAGVKGVTYYVGDDGMPRPKWIKTANSGVNSEWMEAMLERIEPAQPVPVPEGLSQAGHLMNWLPIGDLHLGMMAWAEETKDGNWDLKVAQQIYSGVMDQLIRGAPTASGLVVNPLGDFLHYDGQMPLTPKNKNLLDTDTRFGKIIPAAMNCVEFAVSVGLQTHEAVHLIMEIGNHDPASTLWMREAFKRIYRNEPRVTVDTSPSSFHYFRFGKVLVGTTHGDTVKLPQLPMIMATDRPEDWGQTKFRYWHTGHVHHDQAKDYPGVKVESHRVTPPLDAYAAEHGYRSVRDNKIITYHATYGEVSRSTINAEMFDGTWENGEREII